MATEPERTTHHRLVPTVGASRAKVRLVDHAVRLAVREVNHAGPANPDPGHFADRDVDLQPDSRRPDDLPPLEASLGQGDRQARPVEQRPLAECAGGSLIDHEFGVEPQGYDPRARQVDGTGGRLEVQFAFGQTREQAVELVAVGQPKPLGPPLFGSERGLKRFGGVGMTGSLQDQAEDAFERNGQNSQSGGFDPDRLIPRRADEAARQAVPSRKQDDSPLGNAGGRGDRAAQFDQFSDGDRAFSSVRQGKRPTGLAIPLDEATGHR